MIIAYLIAAIIWFSVNAALYGSALWSLWKGIKSKQVYWFIWPALLLVANLFVVTIHRPQLLIKLKAIESGQFYASAETPTTLTIYGTGGKCDPRCAELLLEGHIKYLTIASPPANKNQQSLTFEKADSDCFSRPNYFSNSKSIDAFWGHCVQPTSVPIPAASSAIAYHWNDSDIPTLKGTGLKGLYWSGIAITDISGPTPKPLAVKGAGTYKAIAFPLSISLFESKMEGSLGGKISLHKTKIEPEHPKKTSTNHLSYREAQVVRRKEFDKKTQIENILIEQTLGLELNGKIETPRDTISVEDARVLLRQAIDAGTQGGRDRGFMESIPEFAHAYEDFPFVALMEEYISDDPASKKRFPHIAADRYLSRYLRNTHPAEYKKRMIEKKAFRAKEKAKLQANIARRFCEQESRRDGRDCSEHYTEEK